ncbi:Hypothetical protein CINCED_3A017198 [Cinara cedri]|uniref:Uncharacterized protein n=1 Tax=Cinara cedri TaxID=506608 RepID=A0A5E4M675_9HEMI|nr:Hypothetical protein CINCED_3A017198 [Cinara cedri]
MIKPKSKHTIRHILELPSGSPPSKRPAAKPPDAVPWVKRRKLILPPVNKQEISFIFMPCKSFKLKNKKRADCPVGFVTVVDGELAR